MEDTRVARGVSSGVPRGNVVYEAGLFAGSRGEERVFVAHAEGTKIPSGYLGVTTAAFDLQSPDVGGIAARVGSRMDHLGPKPITFISGNWWQIVRTEDDRSELTFVLIKPQTDGRSVVVGGPAWTESGKRIVRWDTLATKYCWKGMHPKDAGVPEYYGIGMIRYGLNLVIGECSSGGTARNNRHGHDGSGPIARELGGQRLDDTHGIRATVVETFTSPTWSAPLASAKQSSGNKSDSNCTSTSPARSASTLILFPLNVGRASNSVSHSLDNAAVALAGHTLYIWVFRARHRARWSNRTNWRRQSRDHHETGRNTRRLSARREGGLDRRRISELGDRP